MTLPTFLGNHDMGRFSQFVREANPEADDAEMLARVKLGHAMLLTLRGSPVIYSGDEQGFVSDGGDQLAREDMFASVTDVYNDNDLIGTEATTADENFDTAHPLYRWIGLLSNIRKETPALRRGRQVTRAYGAETGLFAVSRFDPDTDRETLLMFNTSEEAISGQVLVEVPNEEWTTILGKCAAKVSAPGSLSYELPALGFSICEAR